MSLLDKIINCYDSVAPFQVTIAATVILLCILYFFFRDMNVPPGPKGLPLIGYWPFLNADTSHLQLKKLTGKYGDVFSFRIAGKLLIHLGSIKAIREAHITKSDCFSDRYTEDSLLTYAFKDGLVYLNDEPWKVLRKFFVSKFKEYGMNAVKENAARQVYDALKETVEELRRTKGHPIPITDMITMKSMIIMRRIIFNDQGISMEELQELNDHYCEMMKSMTSTNMLLIGNFAKYFMFPFMSSIWRVKKSSEGIRDILNGVIHRHTSEYNESNIADLVDSYIKERNDRQMKGDPTAKYFTDEGLNSTLGQILTDGVLTIGVFVGNFLILLAERPEEQEKIYKEIIENVGIERVPSLEDKSNLPYTNAFIYEVTRYTDFFPVFTSMVCTKETTLQGYRIPTGSITHLNIFAAHRNPNDFESPDEFNPSRYLPKPGKPRPNLPILFGVGKRSCIGEAFSIIQTFLFLTTIVQNFHLSFPKDSEVTSAMFWSEEKIKICVQPRCHKSH